MLYKALFLLVNTIACGHKKRKKFVMTTKEFAKNQNKTEQYARHWFTALANYHCVMKRDAWRFDEADVIAFLKSKVKEKFPTWKRLAIVKSLIWYRDNILKSNQPSLDMVRPKLQERIIQERMEKVGSPIDDVVGKINPREPDVIRELRRTARLQGKAYNTEKAYVQKVRAFMEDRGLKTLADFGRIGSADVEAHLTDLAVDGDVAP